MIDSTIAQLNKLRGEPERIVICMEKDHNSASVIWQQRRWRRWRMMDGVTAEDKPAETPEDYRILEMFYIAVDTVLRSMKYWIEKNQPLLKPFSLFAPSGFSKLVKNFKTAHDLLPCLSTFCETYNMYAFRCDDKLFNFARSFKKFDYTTISNSDEDNQEEEEDSDNEKLSPACSLREMV